MKRTETRLIIALLLTALVIPLCNIALLGSLSVITENDVAYPERVSQIISYAKELIGVICVFASSGMLAFAFVLRKCRRAAAWICFLSVPLTYLVSGICDMAFYGTRAFSIVYVIPMLVNCIFECLRYLAVIIIAKRIGDNARKTGRGFALEVFSAEGATSRAAIFTSLTVFVTLIVTSLTDTIALLAEYGAPLNSSEATYLVLPYLTAVVYTVIGYLVIYCIGRSAVR